LWRPGIHCPPPSPPKIRPWLYALGQVTRVFDTPDSSLAVRRTTADRQESILICLKHGPDKTACDPRVVSPGPVNGARVTSLEQQQYGASNRRNAVTRCATVRHARERCTVSRDDSDASAVRPSRTTSPDIPSRSEHAARTTVVCGDATRRKRREENNPFAMIIYRNARANPAKRADDATSFVVHAPARVITNV